MIVNRENLQKKLREVFPFNLASQEVLTQLAARCEVVFFNHGEMIFLESAHAKFLYIVFEGSVEILKEQGHAIQRKNITFSGGLFGEDVFSEKKVRRTSARSLSDSILIRLNQAVLSQFIRQAPEVTECLQALAASYSLLVKSEQASEMEGESILYMGQPHQIFLFLKTIFLALVVGLLVAALVPFANWADLPRATIIWSALILFGGYLLCLLWSLYDWANDLFIFTDRRIISQERRLFSFENRGETPLSTIISHSSQASLLGRQFGFGHVLINTFSGSFKLKNVPAVESVLKQLEFLIEQAHLGARLEEQQGFEKVLRERHGEESSGPTREKPEREESHFPVNRSAQRASVISRIFSIKRIQGASVIYRTHWLFLFSKTVFPIFTLLGILLVSSYLGGSAPEILAVKWVSGLRWGLLAAALLWWLYQYLDWRNDQYMITPEQVVDVSQKPFGWEDKRSAPLENIQSIRYRRQGLLGLLFNFGTVSVKVGNEDFTFDHVYDPMEVQQTLFAYLEHASLIEKRTSLAAQQRQVADWMDAYDHFRESHLHGEGDAE